MMLALKNVLFTVFVPGTVAGYVPWRLTRGAAARGEPWALAAAGLLFALGIAGYVSCVWHFAVRGGGTPAPIDAPKRLVVSGLHRWVRNPMYVSVLTVIAGWTVLYGSRALATYLAAAALVMHLFVVLYEEPMLARNFGAEYADYRRRVGRWLPRLRLPPT